MTKAEFRRKCQQLGNFSTFYLDDRGTREFEDDGLLHIVRHGIRAVFDVSNLQNDTGREQNRKTKVILNALNIKVTNMVLTNEDDEE